MGSFSSLSASALLVAMALPGCGRGAEASPGPGTGATATAPATAMATGGGTATATATATGSGKATPTNAINAADYPWIGDPTCKRPEVVDTLEARFAVPDGFKRVDLKDKSFGSWLRKLPLAAAGTPVLSYGGGVVAPANHPNIAAVSALDIGKGDLQQCADSIIRLHAEWLWSQGRRDMEYKAAAGIPLPYSRWAQGDRLIPKGASLEWKPKASAPRSDHETFRKYLDSVFMFANTGSVAKQAQPVPVGELAPGDFVVMAGNPGHAVLVLDLAVAADGRKVALLGQGYMPAQSFQVLRPSGGSPWFVIDANAPALATPFWRPFPWSLLRRWGE